MTTQQAFKLIKIDEPELTDEVYEACADQLIKAGYCPACARQGEHSRLGRHEPATPMTYAGRTCCTCEEFYRNTDAPDVDYDTSPECFSDADSGL